MKRKYYVPIYVGCILSALMLLITIQLLVIDDSDGVWSDEDHSDNSWIRYLGKTFWTEQKDELPELTEISCYTYRSMTDENGHPRHYQFERSADQLKARGCKKRMPHALVIGVKKGGTTAMGKYLGLHPLVSYSLFVQPGPKINDSTMKEWKEKFTLSSKGQMSFTGYPGLFNDMQPQLLQMARTYLPDDLKLILMLRDPVQRLISDYVHTVTISDSLEGDKRKQYNEIEGLKDSLEATILDELGHVNPFASIVRLGMYHIDLQSLYQHIPEERILIIDGNEFRKDPFPVLLEVEKYLDLPPFFKRDHFQFEKKKHFYCAYVPFRPDVRCFNSQKGRKHPDISDDLLKKLYEFYRFHNKELENKFGLKFSWSSL